MPQVTKEVFMILIYVSPNTYNYLSIIHITVAAAPAIP